MRLLTNKQIRRIEHKGYIRGVRLGYDSGYRAGYKQMERDKELDAVILAEIDEILRGK